MTRAEELRRMFNQINRDCLLGESQVIPLDNVEYYTQQIMNIYGLEYYEANQLAKDMREIAFDEK